MSKFVNFIKTAIVFLLGNVFSKMLSFLLLPLYTNKIEPEAYGQYGLVMSVLNVVVPVAYLCIWDGVFRISYEAKEERGKYVIINNGIAVMVMGTIVFSMGTIIFSMIVPIEYMEYIIPTGIMLAVQYFYSFSARALGESKFFVLSGCINSGTILALNCIFIGIFNKGIWMVYLSYIIGTLFQVLVMEYKLRLISSFRIKDIEWSYILQCAKFSLPIAFNSISVWFLLGFTQFIISHRLGVYYNGQFNVANKFSSIIALLVNVVQFAWYELAYELFDDEQAAKKYYHMMLNYMFTVLILAFPCIVFGIKMIYPFYVGKMYQESLALIPALMLGTIFNAYAGFMGTIFLAYKESDKLMLSIAAAGFFNVVFAVAFTKSIGVGGIVIIYCIANYIRVLVEDIQLKKSRGIGIIYEPMSIMVIIGTIIGFFILDGLKLALGLISYFLILVLINRNKIILLIEKISVVLVSFKKENKKGL